jgi:hypothetical protein
MRSTDILMDQARNSKQVLDILNATVKSLQAELKADQENMHRMEVFLHKTTAVYKWDTQS